MEPSTGRLDVTAEDHPSAPKGHTVPLTEVAVTVLTAEVRVGLCQTVVAHLHIAAEIYAIEPRSTFQSASNS